jgi:hypothetical protein
MADPNDYGLVDVAWVQSIVMAQAICTCGWRQLHYTETAARLDADEHQREQHPHIDGSGVEASRD